MHPAFSVIFLTTLIGVGQGLFLALYAAELAAGAGWLPAPGQGFLASGSAIAAAFLGAGLFASFFHLGRPERAWRSASKWKTSWLSREVIVLPLFITAALAYGALHFFGQGGTRVVGAVGVAACVALFVCTGMIYACIRFLQEWATPLTIVNFMLLGCASGATCAAAYAAAAAPELAPAYARWAIALTLAGACTRIASLVRNARLRPKSTLQTAIGIKHPRIEQKAQGAMGGSFNTREFMHGRSVELVRAVKWGFLLLAFAVPVALLAAGASSRAALWIVPAFVVQYVGLIAERWFFFAQARHPQNLYYQAIS